MKIKLLGKHVISGHLIQQYKAKGNIVNCHEELSAEDVRINEYDELWLLAGDGEDDKAVAMLDELAANCRYCPNVLILRFPFGVPLVLLWFAYGALMWIRSAFKEGSKVMQRNTALTNISALPHEVGLVASGIHIHLSGPKKSTKSSANKII